MLKKSKTKTNSVLYHLQTFGSITSIEAFELYGATRLSAIIFELKKHGVKITATRVPFVDRFGNKGHCAQYKLADTTEGDNE